MKNSERTKLLNYLNNNKIDYTYKNDVITVNLSVTEWDDEEEQHWSEVF